MVGDQGEPRRRATGSFVAAAGEAVDAGFRALQHVEAGLSESLRRSPPRSGRSAGRARAAAPSAAGARPPHAIVDELADFTADILDRMGEAARDIAGHIGEHDRSAPPSPVPRLELEGAPGRRAKDKFWFRNTGGTALKQVSFEATDLLGAGRRIDAGSISFEHSGKDQIERLQPGGLTAVIVAVDIPRDAVANIYRGVIVAVFPPPSRGRRYDAGPVGAWALLELEVLATDRGYR